MSREPEATVAARGPVVPACKTGKHGVSPGEPECWRLRLAERPFLSELQDADGRAQPHVGLRSPLMPRVRPEIGGSLRFQHLPERRLLQRADADVAKRYLHRRSGVQLQAEDSLRQHVIGEVGRDEPVQREGNLIAFANDLVRRCYGNAKSHAHPYRHNRPR